MSHPEQVLAALKKIGGKGALKDIVNAIDDIDTWGAKKPVNSVGSILSGLTKEGLVRLEGKTWILKGVKIFEDLAVKRVINSASESNLYLITIHPFIKFECEGLPFKVGSSDKGLKARLRGYNQSLPFETIRHITTYPVQLPNGVSLEAVEKKVRNRLLRSENFVKLHGGNQNEWFSAIFLQSASKQEHINKLAADIRGIINDVIADLKKGQYEQ